MVREIFKIALGGLLLSSTAAGCDGGVEPDIDGVDDAELRSGNGGSPKLNPPKFNIPAYNLHLERTVRYNPTDPFADPDHGRALFGIAADLVTEDASEAIFEGPTVAGQTTISSNGRTCFTCHRGLDAAFGMPDLPVSDHVAMTDPIFTGIEADAGGDPDAFDNLNERGLFKYRVNRFDPRRGPDDPYKQVFGWRKSPQLLNIGLAQGFLNDLRGRNMFETARGAVFAHTQTTDNRFDDLFPVQSGNDMEAFLFSLFTDPQLAALRDPSDPAFEDMVEDPFLTVATPTNAQRRGKKVFAKKCFACHNAPQTFGNLDNVEAQGNGERPPNFPGWAPAVSRSFNVGVAEANFHNLRFTRYVGPGEFEPIVLVLAGEDGAVIEYEVETDIGLAMTTGRLNDVGRFKVPQLRNLADNAPYMHDNSLATIEDVVDYFDSDEYNDSLDGQDYPIHLKEQEKEDLIEFLYAL